MNVSSPLLVNISVYTGHSAEGFRERTPLASTLIERWYIAPGVQRIKVKETGLRGTLFIPSGTPTLPFMIICSPHWICFRGHWNLFVPAPGPGPFPGLLEMWGGGGGLVEYRASLLASNGYACFALEYIFSDEADPTDVPTNYFEVCVNLLLPDLLSSVWREVLA